MCKSTQEHPAVQRPQVSPKKNGQQHGWGVWAFLFTWQAPASELITILQREIAKLRAFHVRYLEGFNLHDSVASKKKQKTKQEAWNILLVSKCNEEQLRKVKASTPNSHLLWNRNSKKHIYVAEKITCQLKLLSSRWGLRGASFELQLSAAFLLRTQSWEMTARLTLSTEH